MMTHRAFAGALLLALCANTAAHAQDCRIDGPDAPVSNPTIELRIDCPGAALFQLSESPDFRESAAGGVRVRIDAIDPGGEHVDLSIEYPDGRDGNAATPFALPDATRELRVLGVLFDVGDGSPGRPAYATPAWVEKLLFGADHDGRGHENSLAAHLAQSTHGRVALSGEVYPEWVELGSIEGYRDLEQGPSAERRFAADVVARLVADDPGFFAGRDFDVLIGLTPGMLATSAVQPYTLYGKWPDPQGLFEGYALFDIPVDSASPLHGPIVGETRVAHDARTVVTRYGPQSVAGVWLASDVARSGTNYYTGGQVRYDTSNANSFARFIELGTPLPADDATVVVDYAPRVYKRLDDAALAAVGPDTMPDTSWFGLPVHEFYHAADWLIAATGGTILDLYQGPMESIDSYDQMARGTWNRRSVDGRVEYVPGNLGAYSKVALGLAVPHTLAHGENASGLRLHRADGDDAPGELARTRAIRVPLHPPGRTAHRQLVDPGGGERRFAGEEYLLLEWRSRAPRAAGGFSFDAALAHEGLVVYRVLEGDPSRHGDDRYNVVEVIDATPPAFPFDSLADHRNAHLLSLGQTPAPFGEDSGVLELVAGEAWSTKAADAAAAGFTLSGGDGTKTVHARLIDLAGTPLAETAVSVTLAAGEPPPPDPEPDPDPTVVAAPSALDATASGREVSLGWNDNADNESGFEIEMATKARGKLSPYATVATVGADVTALRLALEPGSYAFRVAAVAADGTRSAESNTATVGVKGGGGKRR